MPDVYLKHLYIYIHINYKITKNILKNIINGNPNLQIIIAATTIFVNTSRNTNLQRYNYRNNLQFVVPTKPL